MEKQNENSILAKKSNQKIPKEEKEPEILTIDDTEVYLEDKDIKEKVNETPIKRPKGRPKKPIDKEAEDFKKRVAEETEKAYREVIESKIKSNIKRELKNKALEDGERYKDPEPKAERPKKVLSEKQMENLAKGREIAIARTKNKRDIHKQIDEEVKTIKEAKKKIRKTLLVDKIREKIDGLDSDEDEEEIVIQKKPKVKKIVKYEEKEEIVQPKEIVKPSPKIQWF